MQSFSTYLTTDDEHSIAGVHSLKDMRCTAGGGDGGGGGQAAKFQAAVPQQWSTYSDADALLQAAVFCAAAHHSQHYDSLVFRHDSLHTLHHW